MMTSRHADPMTATEMNRTAVRCRASFASVYGRDALVFGPVSAVRRALACMGFGFDAERTGPTVGGGYTQRVFDSAGRCWGTMSTSATGQASVRLDYVFAPRATR